MAIRLKLLMPPKSVFTIQVWLFEPNIYCLELPREFSEVYNMAVHILGRGVFGLLSHPNLPMMHLYEHCDDGRHTRESAVYLSAWNMRACSATASDATRVTKCSWSLSPLKLGKQLLLIPVAFEFHVAYIRSTFLTIMEGSSGTEFYTNIIVSPQQYL